MSKCSISKQLAQVKPGTLYIGVDLALENNVVIVITEKAERLDHFSFPHTREGYEFFLRRLEHFATSIKPVTLWLGWSQPITSGSPWQPIWSRSKSPIAWSMPIRSRSIGKAIS